MCGSRPVIDQGWLPLSRQVGKSGAYGQAQALHRRRHQRRARARRGNARRQLIVAVNTDPQAPIFNVAHYGIVGDAQDVLPALTEAVRARSGKAA